MKKRIQFYRFNSQKNGNFDDIFGPVSRVIKGGKYILGPEVHKFEKDFATYCNAKYCVSVGNGSDALFFALKSIGISDGDEVIVPTNTFISSWLAITRANARPVPIEPNLETYNIDYKKIENLITEKTKAIMIVHLYGQPAEIDRILEISTKYNLKIVEDAAQSVGAKFRNKIIGSISDVTAWSFYPTKNLGCLGDGGAITTNKKFIFNKVKYYRNYGSLNKSNYDLRGYNSRLDTIQAAILIKKLKKIDQFNKKKIKIAENYLLKIKNKKILLPKVLTKVIPTWHLFVIRVKQRKKFIEFMNENGIETMIHYPKSPIKQKAFSDFNFKVKDFPVTKILDSQVVSIPSHPQLTNTEQDYIINKINSF